MILAEASGGPGASVFNHGRASAMAVSRPNLLLLLLALGRHH